MLLMRVLYSFHQIYLNIFAMTLQIESEIKCVNIYLLYFLFLHYIQKIIRLHLIFIK